MTAARHSAFHRLRVAGVDRITDDAVALTFEVPPALRETYRFTPGQHVTLRRFTGPDGGAEIRRTYSVCDPAPHGDGGWPAGGGPAALRVGVRLVEGGAFSPYALKELLAGDEIEVMAPAGRFGLAGLAAGDGGHFAAVVGGSGITPVLSIAATVLASRPAARFCLVRSDRTAASTMFLDEVADLKDRYPGRFQLVQVLSREEQQAGLPSGRLDGERLAALLPALLPVGRVDAWFLCGPYGLVSGAERALSDLGVDRSRVHQEIFHVDDGTGVPATAVAGERSGVAGTVHATLDGRGGSWASRDGESLLETVLRNRADAPYACKGGVCGTCRAKLVAGEVRMDRNFALEPEELDAGYVLACQSHPVTEKVELDFDA
ncbi:2Fe-2S iron-sulfur cluster-binding protein [Streptomyces sp. SL13]|uniref:2Fe-2S iron-sulfur cluster-binding protein n=1 Tax=Streptantibioticus silvisoli TaxID=2705255 RepID=A0AA90H9Q5_9ACTN|nr:2Fe-2S iron-sulfur cluster-binding protein [Streptantibioticus silvisoli]MDI5970597.1 2Fe-2S iron-sulfur cluster-binding protein [Streptantibioticus silvisoli]